MSEAYSYISEHTTYPSLHVPDQTRPRLEVVRGPIAPLRELTYIDRDGMNVREVSFPDISDHSPDRQALQDVADSYEEIVRQHPDWKGPDVKTNEQGERELVYNNPLSEEVYEAMPALKSWRTELVPGAVALYTAQYPEERYLPNGVEIDKPTQDMFTLLVDPRGIRSRAKAMSQIAANYINTEGATDWASLACGAAVPVFDAIKDNAGKIQDIKLRLIDFDPSALDFAKDLAEFRHLTEGSEYEIMNRNLLKELIATDRLVQELGEESMDFVDALGIFEYFNEERSARFLANSYRLVKPGGALVTANMLDTHPNLHFNQRVIGWPKIYPRSVDEIKRIIAKAGIDIGNVSMTIPSDGVYAVFEINK